jgi:hypothetical protein
VLLHVAVYAGIPVANTAFSTAKKEFDQSTSTFIQDADTRVIPQEDV